MSDNEELYKIIFDNSKDAIFVVEVSPEGLPGKFIEANAMMYQKLGYTKAELMGMDPVSILDIELDHIRFLMKRLCFEKQIVFETTYKNQAGQKMPIEVKVHMFELKGRPVLLGISRDISERRQSEEALKASEGKLRRITDNMLDVVYQCNAAGILEYVSPSSTNIIGYTPAMLLGNCVFDFIHPEDLPGAQDAFQMLCVDGSSQGGIEFRCRHADGHYVWLETVGKVQWDKTSAVCGITLASRNITARRQMEEKLKYYSLHDTLTGVYNRAYFEQEINRLEEAGLTPAGVIICDVDGLKLINNALGHAAGDALLVAVADVICRSFGPEATIARIGGDEFVILLPRGKASEVEAAYKSIQESVARYNADNPQLALSISVGYAVSDGVGFKIADLIKEADNNMYREKLHRSKSVHNATVQALMKALEARDFITEGHGERMQDLVSQFGTALGLSETKVADLRLLAQFHDIGKVGIPDRILFKPGRLTPDEFDEMKKHSEIGYRIAQAVYDLAPIADFILNHHEWWDGTGYPFGLKGGDIPLECRILAIIDAYDAITNDRPYRRAQSAAAAAAEIVKGAGIQFDPQLVDKFISLF